MTEESALSHLSLTAKAEVTKDALVIEYEVQNDSGEVVYFWDRMIDYTTDGDQMISPDSAYVFFEEPRTLDVIRANLSLPKSVRVATKETPYVRAIAAGGRAAGRISLKLPVQEFSPYFGYSGTETPVQAEIEAEPPFGVKNSEQREATQIRLMIGWTAFRPGMVLEEAIVGGEKVLLIKGSWPQPYQQILEKRLDVKVPVYVAKDNFERTMPLQ
jgi:hypothetical protein